MNVNPRVYPWRGRDRVIQGSGFLDMSEQSSSVAPQAARFWQAWVRFFLPVALGLWADLALKAYSFPGGVIWYEDSERFHAQGRFVGETQPLIPHVLGIVTTVNDGAVFGLGRGKVTWFVCFSLIAIGTIGWVFARSRRSQVFLHVALGLILAGALGNLYDRIVYHGVRDMLLFNVRWYPFVFNIADVLLCVGVPLLMLCWLFPGVTAEEGQGFEVGEAGKEAVG